MPSELDIRAERERLYESPSLRDDLYDEAATILLSWGEAQVERLAAEDDGNFAQQCRFLRQLIKHINRFVGQREFNDRSGQENYLSKVMDWLPRVGFEGITMAQFFDALPPEPDMVADVRAVLNVITPADDDSSNAPSAEGSSEPPSPGNAYTPPHTDDPTGAPPITGSQGYPHQNPPSHDQAIGDDTGNEQE